MGWDFCLSFYRPVSSPRRWVRARPLPPILDRVKQTATGSHLYRDNSCNFGGSLVDVGRTCKCSDCRRVVAVDCMARLPRATAIYYGNSSHSYCSSIDTGSLSSATAPSVNLFCDWNEQFFRSCNSFFFSFFLFLLFLAEGGKTESEYTKKNGRCNLGGVVIMEVKKKKREKKMSY